MQVRQFQQLVEGFGISDSGGDVIIETEDGRFGVAEIQSEEGNLLIVAGDLIEED